MSRNINNAFYVFCLVCVFFQSNWVYGQPPVEKGLEIAMEADKRSSGFGDFTARMKMVLRGKEGRESIRKIRVRTMETQSDGDKSLTIFDSPRDVKGTAFLTYTHKVGDDDQWLYLPALKRVKRISSRNKSGAFMGSEFSFEDMSSMEVEKYTYKYLGMETLNGKECFVLERYPVDKENSGYSKMVSWLDTKEYRVFKEEYYDKRNKLLKTLVLSDYTLYMGKYWMAHTMKMVNHQNGKETDLNWFDFSFANGLNERDFTKNSLKRSR